MIIQIFHILSSISLLPVIYLINNDITIGIILKEMGVYVNYNLPQWISYLVYVIIVILFAGIVINLSKYLRPGEIRKNNIEQLDSDNSALLGMMLAYIFVGLSITNTYTLIIVILFLVIFNLCGTSHIYNPLFYIFGYRYYYITSSKTKILLMTKNRYRLGTEADLPECKCLNDYTYIDFNK